jgi:hypothetical protein
MAASSLAVYLDAAHPEFDDCPGAARKKLDQPKKLCPER